MVAPLAPRPISGTSMIRPLRRSFLQALRKVDDAVGRHRGKLRVLVDVRTPMNLAVLRPVWKALTDDPRIALTVTAEDMAAVRAALEADGLEELLAHRDAVLWTRFDLAMTADAWNHTALRRCRRWIKFFHGVAGKYDLDDPAKLGAAALDTFDRLAFVNEDRMQRYLTSGIIRTDQAVLVGFPKLDALVNGAWNPASVRQSLGLSPTVETVLYAPTFSTANSLHLAGEAIVRALLETGRNVIVKLHDRSATPHPKYTDGIDWPARLAAFESSPRFALARRADIGPLLSAANLLVTDHSTVGFEFALLDRPIVVYDAPDLQAAARIDAARWAQLRSMADVVSSPEALAPAVDTALAAPALKHEARRSAHALFANAGRATEVALDVVYELLEVKRPAVAKAAA
jgi:CDP-Glycerol:Poly(glycerophosphate) glycerophosphotransferase